MDLASPERTAGLAGVASRLDDATPSPDPRRLMTTPSRITLSPKGERVN
jgi:hypothetical protein